MNVFLDTEFTDFLNLHLISLGMASEYGEDFYAEVPYSSPFFWVEYASTPPSGAPTLSSPAVFAVKV